MVGFLIIGHGKFASGLVSAIELVAGQSNRIVAVDFLQSYSTDDLKYKLIEAVSKLMETFDEIIIMSDLMGGSPYNQCVMLKDSNPDLKIEVISGANFPMILTGITEDQNLDMNKLIEAITEKGKEGISSFIQVPFEQIASQKTNYDEDGI